MANKKKKAPVSACADPDFTCKHRDCIYRTRIKGTAHKCDFLNLTGRARIKVCAPGHEKPANCDQYLSQDSPEGQVMYAMLKEDQSKRRACKSENPCFDCTDKRPGCNCEKRKIYWAGRDGEYNRRLEQAKINGYMCDAINKNKKVDNGKYWDVYRE